MSLVAVLSNPHSTRNKTVMNRVRQVIARHRDVFHFEIDAITDISEGLRHFADSGADLLVINGGDGTIQATFSCLFNEKPFKKLPRIVILPAGRTNMIAEDLGAWAPRPYEVLDRLLEDLKTDDLRKSTVTRHILSVEGLRNQPTIYGMFFGTAGIVHGIELCRKKIYPLGLPNFLAHSLAIATLAVSVLRGPNSPKNLFRTDPIHVKLGNKGAVVGVYAVMIATTLERLVLGLRPFVREGKGNMKFASVELMRGTLLKALSYTILGRTRDRPNEGIVVRNVTHLQLRQNCLVTIDGELYQTGENQELTLSTPHSLEFIRVSKKPIKS